MRFLAQTVGVDLIVLRLGKGGGGGLFGFVDGGLALVEFGGGGVKFLAQGGEIVSHVRGDDASRSTA